MVPIIQLPQNVSNVPFHSQIQEIKSHTWQQQGCGITSLAMIVDYYSTAPVSVNTMLGQGIALNAYVHNVGWSYAGLIAVSRQYGLDGKSYDLGKSAMGDAFKQFQASLKDGPVIASIHYKFDPESPLPHLVVIDGISEGIVYYNDPAAKTGQKQISVTDFKKGWKKRFIVIRPVPKKEASVAMNY